MSSIQLPKRPFGENCVCVGRISTVEQSTTAQIADLEAFAKEKGYKEVKVFFTTESGFLEYDMKQGWNQVVEFFEQNPSYRTLIVPEISRLSRRESILMKIKEYLVEHKIQLIIKDIKFSLFDEWGEIPKGNSLVFSLYASLADSEMRQKKERTRRALLDYRRQGFSIGGPVLFGYNRVQRHFVGKMRSTYELNPTEVAEILQIYQWYAYGIDGNLQDTTILTITQECIARNFSPYLHSKRNVNKCLKEEAYLGYKETHNKNMNPEYWNYQKKDAPRYVESGSYGCKYPAIFDDDHKRELYYRVQKRLKENNSRYSENSPVDKSRKHTTILGRLIPCPECGRYLCAEYRNRKEGRVSMAYRCNYSRGVVEKCSYTNLISLPMLDSVVWAVCRDRILNMLEEDFEKQNEDYLNEHRAKIMTIQSKIDEFDYEGQVKRVTEVFSTIARKSKNFDTKGLEEKLDKINQEYRALTDALYTYKKQEERIICKHDFKTIREGISKLTNDKIHVYDWLHKLIDHVEIVATHQFYTILRVHFLSGDISKYIFIRKKTSLNLRAFELIAYDANIVKQYKEEVPLLNNLIDFGYFAERFPIDIKWDKSSCSFVVGDVARFSVDDIMATIPQNKLYNGDAEEKCFVEDVLYNRSTQDKVRKLMESNQSEVSPSITFREIHYTRFDFYEEDFMVSNLSEKGL